MKSSLAIPVPLLLLFGVFIGFLVLGAVSIPASSYFTPFNAYSFDTSRGKALFRQNCSSCHAVQRGVVGGFGPNLHNIGETAGQRVDGLHAQDYILQSILDPEAYRAEGSGHMPSGTVAGVPVEIVRSLVGYLSSLGGVVDKAHLERLAIDVDELAPQPTITSISQLQHGWDLFYNELGCVACHAINGIPGSDLRAPSLEKAGILSEQYILTSIRNPDASIADIWRTTTVTLEDGSTLVGRVLHDDDVSLVLLHNSLTEGGLLVREDFDKAEIKQVSASEKSAMPAYTLTIKDEQALVSFLKSLVAEL